MEMSPGRNILVLMAKVFPSLLGWVINKQIFT